jgi:hypothetical protein
MLFNWQDDWQGHHLYMTACDAAYSALAARHAGLPKNGLWRTQAQEVLAYRNRMP